jgi:hypothetical protein
MRWLIVYLLAMAVIWLFIKHTGWRRGLMAAVTVTFIVFMTILALQEEKQVDQAPAPTARQLEQVREDETVSYAAMQASDIALRGSSLNMTTTVRFDSAGREQVITNPDEWQLAVEVANRSDRYTARDMTLLVRLFSCPPFFATEQADATLEVLRVSCVQTSQRTVGLTDINLAPGGAGAVERVLRFSNQNETRNPRYWIEVQRVTAAPLPK